MTPIAANISNSAIASALMQVGGEVYGKQSRPLNRGGIHNVEFNHRCALHPAYEDKMFVIGQNIKYHNMVQDGSNWTVYCFDLEGKQDKSFNSRTLPDGFYSNLQYLT